jgi:hypothetical protein
MGLFLTTLDKLYNMKTPFGLGVQAQRRILRTSHFRDSEHRSFGTVGTEGVALDAVDG